MWCVHNHVYEGGYFRIRLQLKMPKNTHLLRTTQDMKKKSKLEFCRIRSGVSWHLKSFVNIVLLTNNLKRWPEKRFFSNDVDKMNSKYDNYVLSKTSKGCIFVHIRSYNAKSCHSMNSIIWIFEKNSNSIESIYHLPTKRFWMMHIWMYNIHHLFLTSDWMKWS